jgi:hypothetical protein
MRCGIASFAPILARQSALCRQSGLRFAPYPPAVIGRTETESSRVPSDNSFPLMPINRPTRSAGNLPKSLRWFLWLGSGSIGVGLTGPTIPEPSHFGRPMGFLPARSPISPVPRSLLQSADLTTVTLWRCVSLFFESCFDFEQSGALFFARDFSRHARCDVEE